MPELWEAPRVGDKMGDRGNVIIDGKIWLYTHWEGSALKQTVRDALIRGQSRWDDRPYLIRIIFSEMIKDDIMDTTGYGIDYEEGDGSAVVEIDTKLQTVNGIGFADFCLEDEDDEAEDDDDDEE